MGMRSVGLYLFALCIACTQGCSSGGGESEKALEGLKVLRLSVGDSPQTLDPHQVTGTPGVNVLHALTSNLLTLNVDTYLPEPALAERWTVSDDGMTYTFYLREGLKWSNGEPFLASDVVYSFGRILTPALGNQYALDYYFIEGAEAFHAGETTDLESLGVKAIDQRTIQFKLIRPDALFLLRLTQPQSAPVKQSVVEKHGDWDDPSNRWIMAGNFVGTGPFILEKWELNKVIEAKKNPYYWNKDEIFIDKLIIPSLETETADERLFRAGQIDLTLMGRVPIEKLEYYRTERQDSFISHTIYGTYFYFFNTKDKLFKDVNLRKALALSVDKKLLTDRVTKNGELVANALSPPTPNYQPPEMPEYNPSLARDYLAKAGYPNGEGFPGVTLIYNTLDIHKKIAVALQQMWKKELNIDVTLENQEWKVFLDTRQNHNYEIARAGVLTSIIDPSDFLDSLVTDHGMNDAAWSNTEYDKYIKMAKSEIDPDKRFSYLKKAESILIEELPILPLYYLRYSHFINPKVKGFKFNMASYAKFDGVKIED